MPKTPKSSSVQAFSVREFFARFADDDACLAHIMEVRYGMRHPYDKCLNVSTFHKLANRPAYSCAHCGHHVYPCSGTIFQDSRTSLQVWFYAIYLFVTTRPGVSGKELQRTLGVTYKTAWRIGQQIRTLMSKVDGFACRTFIDELGDGFSGFAIVAWGREGELRSAYDPGAGPIRAAIILALAGDALNRHVALDMAPPPHKS